MENNFLHTLQVARAVLPAWFFPFVSFIFGSIFGSFLNVCIHRMPRGDSIVAPRSKCYGCGKFIHWFDNLPILSYILLGGKCRNCGAKYSIRYWLVEWLTALLFVLLWKTFPPATALIYTIFVCGMIVATFIDFEHYIIPNEITLGGIIIGTICSGLVPSMQDATMHSKAALWSLAGAAAGYLTLWGVVELGKRMFGVKKLVLHKPTEVFITTEGIRIEKESETWEEIFSRESDVLEFKAIGVRLGDKNWEEAHIRVNWKEVSINDEIFKLDEIKELMAVTQTIHVPREAMGFGDVKYIAAIGAFLGPKAIFFVIFFSSVLGSIIGVGMILIGKKDHGRVLPYGPYLSVAALVWIFWGSRWVEYYYPIMTGH